MRCPSGKRTYLSPELASGALLEAHITFRYPPGGGPRNYYQCEDCGAYHLTSSGTTAPELEAALKSGEIERESRARQWGR